MSPYDVLGVSPNASNEEVARAYKSLAKRFHPDLNPDDPAAADRMGEINRAYENVKSMRQRGERSETYSYGPTRSAAPFDASSPFETMRSEYRYRYYSRGARRSPMGMILAVVTMFFFVRLLLNILFGGFAGYFYPYDPSEPEGENTVHTYGYYDTIP